MEPLRPSLVYVCPVCSGSGQLATTHGRTICGTCAGTGRVPDEVRRRFCHGVGRID